MGIPPTAVPQVRRDTEVGLHPGPVLRLDLDLHQVCKLHLCVSDDNRLLGRLTG